MGGADINQLHPLSAKLQRQAIGKGDVRDRGRPLLAQDRRLGPLVGDHHGGVGEDLAARRMVGVVVAQHQVLDRHSEALVDLGLQPGRGLGVDRIGGDDAVGRHQEDREVEVVLKAVEIAGDLGDRALGLALGHDARRARLKGKYHRDSKYLQDLEHGPPPS